MARELVAEAVAAEALRDRFPALAAQLGEPWRRAVRVRHRLRLLGPDAEEMSLRLLTSWQLPLDELPAVCAAIGTTAAPRSRARPVDAVMS